MPLSETNNKQSKSIEDLIAELDAPKAPECSDNGHCGEVRKVIKGKRAGSNNLAKAQSFGSNSEPVLHKNIIISKKYSTHAKRSLNNRGQPKKNGAGGKGVWGAPGCELEEAYLDTKDPNYDSEEEADNVVMVCVESTESQQNQTKSNLPELQTSEFESEIKLVILEYFQNGDAFEVIDTLKMFDLSKVKAQLVSYILSIGLEHNNTSKELLSRLLRDLKLELFTEDDFVAGFDLLMKNLDDLVLDNPEAPQTTGTFIARAIADKVLPKEFLNHEVERSDEKSMKALDSARVLVNINDHLFQLSHIWGNKGGFWLLKSSLIR